MLAVVGPTPAKVRLCAAMDSEWGAGVSMRWGRLGCCEPSLVGGAVFPETPASLDARKTVGYERKSY